MADLASADRRVREFLTTLAAARAELLLQHPAAKDIRDVVYLAQQARIPRTGTLPSGTEYSIHGIGCRMTTPSKLQVDVDVLDDGTEIFDPWRLLMFSHSADEPSTDQLLQACEHLVDHNQLRQPKPGWFSPH